MNCTNAACNKHYGENVEQYVKEKELQTIHDRLKSLFRSSFNHPHIVLKNYLSAHILL